ncbi:hypothetical protein GCM10023146_05820 [Nocardioides caricicola]
MRVHPTTRLAAGLLSCVLLVALPTGCSDDGCSGRAYHPDLGADGSETPIQALDVWLSTHEGLSEPPVEDWVVQDSGDPAATEVEITNESGDGWYVTVARTDQGGWVVSAATDDAEGCADELD